MKKSFALTTLLCLLACPSASAIRIYVEPLGVDPDGVYVMYLDAEGDTFDAMDLSIVPDSGEFLNVDRSNGGHIPRGPGQPFTYIDALLTAPTTVPGGQGWSLLNSGTTPTEVRIAGGPIGAKIDTSAPIWLANLMLPADRRGVYAAKFVNAGTTVGTATGQFPIIPEPSCLILLSIGLISLAGTRHCTQRTES